MNSQALLLIEESVETKHPYLNLGNLGLSDEDFVDGSPLDLQLRKCVHLQALQLSNNLPFYNETLRNVKRGSGNQLNDLPKFLLSLNNLSVLVCCGNERVGWGIKEISLITELKKLTWLDLSNNQIDSLDCLDGLAYLSKLNLGGNEISSVNGIRDLHSLQHLALGHNKIKWLKGLENLTNLVELDLSDNHISLLNGLDNLTSLKALNLNNNQIASIGPLENLSALERLDISGNHLKSLYGFENIYSLMQLDVSNNEINDITPVLPFLKDTVNPLSMVFKVSSKSDINEINIKNNPLTVPPVQIAERGNDSILNYFGAIDKQGTDYLYEAKTLIIGQPRAGKTSLRYKLFDSSAPLPKEEETTRGIDINRLKIEVIDNEGIARNLYCNIWDFGGQQIYQTTHQFFLTQRSLYILVIDTGRDDYGNDESNLNYWLQVLELFGGDSPLLLVRNEKNERQITIDIQQRKARFGFLKGDYRLDFNALIPGTVSFNSKRLNDFRQFKEDLEIELKRLPLIGFSMPKNWVKIRDQLQLLSSSKYYINREEFIEICNRNDVFEFNRQMELSSIFHDLGILLHFQKYPNLEDIVILQSTWATEAVFAVLDNPMVQANKGRFSDTDLGEIWKNTNYDQKIHTKLLSLMMQFEVCFQVEKAKTQTYIIPEMLSETPPDDYAWNPDGDLPLYYRYDFMPKGILTRLIVRFNKHLAKLNKEQTVWKTGMVIDGTSLDCPNTRAEITEVWDNKQIKIRVQGNFAKDLMSKLTYQIDELNNEFFKPIGDNGSVAKYKWYKMIPCICKVCSESLIKHFYDYAELLERKQFGKDKIECKLKPFEAVDIGSLIDGVLVKEMYNPVLVQGQKAIKIFLASSSELKNEREQFEIFISRENKHLHKKGIFLQLEIWEDFLDAMAQTRLQDEYNSTIDNCDIFVMLYFTKVGIYTSEEFEKAFKKFKETNLPKIYTYFKNAEVLSTNVNRENMISLWNFQDKLKELGHYQTEFKNDPELHLHFKKQIEILYDI